jgi:hypothetical protein
VTVELIDANTGEVVHLDQVLARRRADQIKVAVEGTWHLIEQAYLSRDWLALGYASWDEYCTREFGTSRLRLPREDRQETVNSLRESGLSIPAIATATGLGYGTIQRAITSPYPNGQGEAQEAPAAEPAKVTGIDGKTYKVRTAKAEPKPTKEATTSARAVPIPDQFRRVAFDLTKITERLQRISESDRFPQNAEKVAASHRYDLLKARDLIQEVINRLPSA